MLQTRTRIITALVLVFSLSSCTGTTTANNGSLTVNGHVESDETRIVTLVPGKVQHVFVREGETVKAGQQILLIDDSVLRKQAAWVDKLIEKGDREKSETEQLLAAMKSSARKQKGLSPGQNFLFGKSHAKPVPLSASTTATATSATATARGVSTAQGDDFVAKRLGELDRKQSDQRKQLERMKKQADDECDASFEQQKQILNEARDAEKKALAKLNAFPLKLGAKHKDDTADELFAVKEKELEKLHELQKKSIAETARMNQSALDDGFDLQKQSLEDLQRGRTMIAAQLQQEREKIEDLLNKKQAELNANLSKLDGGSNDMEKAFRELQSAASTKQSLMTDLGKEQLTARMALIDTELTKAKATREELQSKIEACSIKSPIDGICVSRDIQPGELVVPGPTLLKLADTKSSYVRAFVQASELSRIKLGQKADIQIAAATKKPVSATISEIDTEAAYSPQNVYSDDDRAKQQYGIKLSFDNSNGFAKPGMSAQATIAIGSSGNNVQ